MPDHVSEVGGYLHYFLMCAILTAYGGIQTQPTARTLHWRSTSPTHGIVQYRTRSY